MKKNKVSPDKGLSIRSKTTNYSTPHIAVKDVPFTKTVLMPGDPIRAEVIVKRYLKDVVIVSDVRGIKAYRGIYQDNESKEKRDVDLTVMASGMGMPSMGVYAHELYNFFGVENIIRIGSIGVLQDNINLGDLIISQSASTNSNYYAQYGLTGYNYAATADFNILNLLYKNANKLVENNTKVYVGNILSSDTFYTADSPNWYKLGVLGIEMESAALFTEAALSNKKAGSICTVSDLIFDPNRRMSVEERQNNLDTMIRVALNTVMEIENEEA